MINIEITYPILFYVFAAIAFMSALAMVLSKNSIYSTLALIVTFIALSGIFVLLNAQTLAIINVIVYAGAIMVLFIFVIMLVNAKDETAKLDHSKRSPLITVALMSIVGLASLFFIVFHLPYFSVVSESIATQTPIGYIETLGITLFTEYLFPFELTGILFLTALMGAVIFAKK